MAKCSICGEQYYYNPLSSYAEYVCSDCKKKKGWKKKVEKTIERNKRKVISEKKDIEREKIKILIKSYADKDKKLSEKQIDKLYGLAKSLKESIESSKGNEWRALYGMTITTIKNFKEKKLIEKMVKLGLINKKYKKSSYNVLFNSVSPIKVNNGKLCLSYEGKSQVKNLKYKKSAINLKRGSRQSVKEKVANKKKKKENKRGLLKKFIASMDLNSKNESQ